MNGSNGMATPHTFWYLTVALLVIAHMQSAVGQQQPPPVPPGTGGTITNTSTGDAQFPGKITCSATVTPNQGSTVQGVEFVLGKVNMGVWARIGGNDSTAGVAGAGGVYTSKFLGIATGEYVVRATATFVPTGQLAPKVDKKDDKTVTVK